MELCATRKCPGCGALIAFPVNTPVPQDSEAAGKLDQIAQASCGCWVSGLTDQEMARLLKIIVGRNGVNASWAASARRC
jgi:hypothetical protein